MPSAQRSIVMCAGLLCAGLIAAGDSSTTQPARVHAMFVPQRMDDFAWENDKLAFRVYGPALEKKDGPQSGIDVWMKHTSDLIQPKLYANGHYHEDRDGGLDGYDVGKSPGCGGSAIVRDDQIFKTANFIAWKIIENGPDRCVFTLDYAPVDCGGVSVTEHKTITLEAGSQFNRIESEWTFDAPKDGAPIEAAVGLKMHEQSKTLALGERASGEASPRLIAKWEPTDGKDNGDTGVAIILPGDKPLRVIVHNSDVFAVVPIKSGEKFTYYAGAGWSKNGFPNSDAWLKYVRESAAELAGGH